MGFYQIALFFLSKHKNNYKYNTHQMRIKCTAFGTGGTAVNLAKKTKSIRLF